MVRSLGMPGVGILGVTFGYLFAMDSPSGHPDASYHWGTTLWHEMAHVFTLEASNHFVPRWFSEGISVFGEYFVKDHPRWGWRTAFEEEEGEGLKIRMYNVSPERQEDLGVEIELSRGRKRSTTKRRTKPRSAKRTGNKSGKKGKK